MAQEKSNHKDVVIAREKNPQSTLRSGIEKLGGISTIIKEGDTVFIKPTITLPNGFPTNSNLDIITELIKLCDKAGAGEIIIGSFPFGGTSLKELSNGLNLSSYFRSFGAQLAFLDSSDILIKKSITAEEITSIREDLYVTKEIDGEDYLVPKIILNADKFINLNQVNVDPLFKVRLALQNALSIVPQKFQEISFTSEKHGDILEKEQYMEDYLSKMTSINSIRRADLVINDLFYLMEGAGPFIYKDSVLKKTGFMVLGTDILSVDITTLQLLELDVLNSKLLDFLSKSNFSQTQIEQISIDEEYIDGTSLDIELCIQKLEDLNVRNLSINCGKKCAGCHLKAYHLLNLMKTNMAKDLKYIRRNYFLLGIDPPEPKLDGDIILFGDCAIESTQDREFHKIRKEKKKKDQIKTKIKQNKNILHLPGCPPQLFDCIGRILDYYGKSDLPNLNIFSKLIQNYYQGNYSDSLFSNGGNS